MITTFLESAAIMGLLHTALRDRKLRHGHEKRKEKKTYSKMEKGICTETTHTVPDNLGLRLSSTSKVSADTLDL